MSFLSEDFAITGLHDRALLECALVCKSWNIVAVHVIYKEVYLENIPDFSRFITTILKNKDLASMVKIVELKVPYQDEDASKRAQFYTLLTNLPKLQHFYSIFSPCYELITDALIDSKLQHLICVQHPDDRDYSDDYVNCILHLKDRLERMSLSRTGRLYKRLYVRLDQFKNLKEITIGEVSPDPIEEIDAIMEKCMTVQKVAVHFDIFNEDHPIPTVDEKDIPSLYTPRPTVHTLEVFREFISVVHQSLLVYIVHKYPSLKSFKFVVEYVEVTDISIFRRLIAYISKIEKLQITNLAVDMDWLYEGIGSFWKALHSREPHNLIHLSINADVARTDALVDLETGFDNNHSRIRLPLSNQNFQDMDLFVKYGEHVESLIIIDFKKEDMVLGNSVEGVKLVESLIASILFCENLHTLSFSNCDIHLPGRSMECKMTYLQELTFSLCYISNRAFDMIFSGIKQISTLKLDWCRYLDEHNKITPHASLSMPDTTLEHIFIEHVSHFSYDLPTIIFISISTVSKKSLKRVKDYYFYDFETHSEDYPKKSSESEYNDEKYTHCAHLYISCRSFISLNVNFNKRTFRLPVLQ